mmetsp:Transcript_5504/g.16910  ORF Transcript_5504/g.16910 Transcript_5504/m.16910 type:complete len:149 (+) Transcript_5504:545-991(+)|eukprot:scaffold106555_cov33-Tisochrysis_lutea.AAC.3
MSALDAVEAGHAACRSAYRTLSSGGDVSREVSMLLDAEASLQRHLLEMIEPTTGPRHHESLVHDCTTSLLDAENMLLAALTLARQELARAPVEVEASRVMDFAGHLSVGAAAPQGDHAFNALAASGFKMGWGTPAPPQNFRSSATRVG